MATVRVGRCALYRRYDFVRHFAASARQAKEAGHADKGSFRSRLFPALRNTKTEWYPIPVGVGISFLGLFQFYRVRRREKQRQDDEAEDQAAGNGNENREKGRPTKRKRIRPSGPCLSEISEEDLHNYPNLASFFYRTLKPGIRPLDSSPSALLSPADGRILQFGTIENGEVEQVKGMTYSLDALLGAEPPNSTVSQSIIVDDKPPVLSRSSPKTGDEDVVRADEEFANVNGISYTLPNLFSGPAAQQGSPPATSMDASTTPKSASEAEVRAEFSLGDGSRSWYSPASKKNSPTALYYIVVYLAPGDYHRFHSPTSWIAEKRRHFAGELYSVSPYLQRTLPGLFTLNERVVLLGRWRWGFFSFTPVGATNVGSIKINFDRELRTNSLTTDTAADRAAEQASQRGDPYSGFAEATYAEASKILGGHALRKGEEMGGFQLGSSIVLVFEAPKGHRKSFDEGWEDEGSRKGGWRWGVQKGQKVKFGEAIGWVDDA